MKKGKNGFTIAICVLVLLSGCGTTSVDWDRNTGLSDIHAARKEIPPSNLVMSIEEAQQYLNAAALQQGSFGGTVDWAIIPFADQREPSKAYPICASIDKTKGVHFKDFSEHFYYMNNLDTNIFGPRINDPAHGAVVFEFNQKNATCPLVVTFANKTMDEAQKLTTAIKTLSDAERDGKISINDDPEAARWELIRQSEDPSDTQQFIQKFPFSVYYDQAVDRLMQLRRNLALKRPSAAIPAIALSAPPLHLALENKEKEVCTINRNTLSSAVKTCRYTYENGPFDNHTKMDITKTYKGKYGILPWPGTIETKTTTKTNSGVNGHLIGNTIGTDNIEINVISGNPNELFPIKVGNSVAVNYSLHRIWEENTSYNFDSDSHNNNREDRSTRKIYCVVDDIVEIDFADTKEPAFRIFCVEQEQGYWTSRQAGLNEGQHTTGHSRIYDLYYLPKVSSIVKEVSGGVEANYVLVSQ